MTLARIATATCSILLLCGASSETTPIQIDDASAVYTRAIKTMRTLPAPATLAYGARIETDDVNLIFSVNKENQLKMSLAMGGAHSIDEFAVVDDPLRASAKVTLSPTLAPTTSIALFDPTWLGAYRWLRYGIDGSDPVAINQTASPTPVENPELASSPPILTIATIFAIGPSFYNIKGAGPKLCPNGEGGTSLHLTAMVRPDLHPLTDVIVSDANRFCLMRFSVSGRSGLFGATGTVELHFAERLGYWLISDGLVDVEGRFLGVALKHGTIKFSPVNLTLNS